MRDLELPAQEKLLDLLNNKLSKVSHHIANPNKSSEAICSTVRRYRHKVVLDLRRLHNQSKKDPDNQSNKLKVLSNELATQNKIRKAHEKTISEQKKLIDELMAMKRNPAMDRVRKESRSTELPPLKGGRSRSDSDNRSYGSTSPAKSPLPLGSMFQLTLGAGGEGGGGGQRGGPQRGSQLGHGGPVFGGGGGNGRGGGRGGRGGRGARPRGYGRY